MLIALGVILVLVAITNLLNRPAPESEAERDRRLRLEKASAAYRAGARAMRIGAQDPAITAWKEALKLGDLRGLTGLGIAEFRLGDRASAKNRWRLAAARGEPIAQILMALGRNSTVPMTRAEFIDLLLRAEPDFAGADTNLSVSDMEEFIGVAVLLGHEDYAKEWIPVLEKRRSRYTL